MHERLPETGAREDVWRDIREGLLPQDSKPGQAQLRFAVASANVLTLDPSVGKKRRSYRRPDDAGKG